MTERWRRELRRIRELTPADALLDRARSGPVMRLGEPTKSPRLLVIIAAFVVFAGGSVLAWRAFSVEPVATPTRIWQSGYPSPPPSGYYLLLPDQAEQKSNFTVRFTALTNLPDGTRLDISTTNEGTCCPQVENSQISVTTQDGDCYGFLGEQPSGRSFDVTMTAKPDFEPWSVPGPGDSTAPQQPEGVLRVLGTHFEKLSGDQVQQQDDGSNWLVSSGTIPWPEPRCGGDPIPLFGGSRCSPDEFEQQLQGDDLAESMVEVMGAISQGRMCEFWSVMLPPAVEQQHPWSEFADEWRTWLSGQDFSDAESTNAWSSGPLRWELAGGRGATSIVNVIHGGAVIATLEIEPLPEYCPHCGKNVVPFWGVTAWHLYPSP
jgi:hypothetical protein